MSDAVGQAPTPLPTALRTPRSAGVAGIVFSVLLIVALVLVIVSVPAEPGKEGTWLTDPQRRAAVSVALNLVPFAGIAFLWFIGVVRDRIGEQEDRFFVTVFLGSGLLFIAMLFVSAAFSGGLIAHAGTAGNAHNVDTLAVSRETTNILLRVYAMRVAAVFTLNAAMITLRTRTTARWISISGIVCACILFVSLGLTRWVELLFPVWILIVSIDILRTGLKTPRRA